ncbi:MAG: sodium:proton antiporter [Glaciimonas sp.]|nr:sodium:proton antiporter [Glaciimonas sp.]
MLKKLLLTLIISLPITAHAAELDGTQLSVWWGIPFMGLLASIALGPLMMPGFWHHHFGKIALGWSVAFLIPCAIWFGVPTAAAGVAHAFMADYFPFIILLTALFVVAGGICLRGNLHGTPVLNTGLLALGTVLASLMGTTGASMLLIRPLIRANNSRKHAVHIIVFFIFLVANAGGALTPLGDPPLFLGFLKGIDFSWTFKNIFFETLFMWVALLVIFYFLDRHYYHRREDCLPVAQDLTCNDAKLRLEGKFNFILLGIVIAMVLMSGLWKSGITYDIYGTPVELQNLLRDALLLVVIVTSFWLTPEVAHEGNNFTWEPMLEVGKLFAAIFITIVPVIAMLRVGVQGPFGVIVAAVTGRDGQPNNMMYFWVTGILSSFLDNAPTYLVFFNAASGEAVELMGKLAATLAAISCGAVFMGANSYIGNAPNLMVKAIAEERGIRMPSFFGYMVWACVVLIPLFAIMSFIFFRA